MNWKLNDMANEKIRSACNPFPAPLLYVYDAPGDQFIKNVIGINKSSINTRVQEYINGNKHNWNAVPAAGICEPGNLPANRSRSAGKANDAMIKRICKTINP